MLAPQSQDKPYLLESATYTARYPHEVINPLKHIILHYTEVDLDESLYILCGHDPQRAVSAHFLVTNASRDNKIIIHQLLDPSSQRARHAGVSAWHHEEKLNSNSIGIEIVNLGFKKDQHGNPLDRQGRSIAKQDLMNYAWYAFEEKQIHALIAFLKDLMDEYSISSILGHHDIAPQRKLDPGPRFPWKKLFEQGIGHWYEDVTRREALHLLANQPLNIKWLQTYLYHYGYPLVINGELDQQTTAVLIAFQMHFRPSDYSGMADAETYSILYSLIKKYHPQIKIQLSEALQQPPGGSAPPL